MLKRMTLIACTSLVATIGLVATAQAETQNKILVEVSYGPTAGCSLDPTHLSVRMGLQAVVTLSGNATAPKTVNVEYQVVDAMTKWTVGSRKVTLKKSQDYKLNTARYTVEPGHAYSTRIRMSYKAWGKTVSSRDKGTMEGPSRTELATYNPCA